METVKQSYESCATRQDFDIIANIVRDGSRIMDIGCGDGQLLKFLKDKKGCFVRGMEISEASANKALSLGMPVVQGDAEILLPHYPNDCFDYAILSRTIQATKDPRTILKEMMRVSSYAIVSFPNFAHYRNRMQLLFSGKMPVRKTIPFQWYETPNIHFCSIRDFEDLCDQLGIEIKEKIFLTDKNNLNKMPMPKCIRELISNFFAEYAIFVLTKNEFSLNSEVVLSSSQIAKVQSQASL